MEMHMRLLLFSFAASWLLLSNPSPPANHLAHWDFMLWLNEKESVESLSRNKCQQSLEFKFASAIVRFVKKFNNLYYVSRGNSCFGDACGSWNFIKCHYKILLQSRLTVMETYFRSWKVVVGNQLKPYSHGTTATATKLFLVWTLSLISIEVILR